MVSVRAVVGGGGGGGEERERLAGGRWWAAAEAAEAAGAGDGGGVAPEEEIAEELEGHALSGRNAVEQGGRALAYRAIGRALSRSFH